MQKNPTHLSPISIFLVISKTFILFSLINCAQKQNTSDRVLFFAPHPDDEIFGVGAQIYKYAQSSKQNPSIDYKIVIMTNGDGYLQAYEHWSKSAQAKDLNGDGKIDVVDFGNQRHLESLSALHFLSVPPEKIIFLGYPDSGLGKMIQDKNTAFFHPFTKTSENPYNFVKSPGKSYIYSSALNDVIDIIREFQPTKVFTPTPSEEHQDHSGTQIIVKDALTQLQFKGEHWEYLLHWESHDPLWPRATTNWGDPPAHVPADIHIPLSETGFTADLKAQALHQYQTQESEMNPEYFNNFLMKKEEAYWKSKDKIEDYLEPSHIGIFKRMALKLKTWLHAR